MGRRHTGRKLAMQTLYQADIRNEEIDPILVQFIQESSYGVEVKEWATTLSKNVWDNKEVLDSLIKEYAIDWDISRINPIDKNVLRLAFYELNYTDLHENVILNEAIEIVKKYSNQESAKFINGILGSYLKAHPRTHS